MKGNGSKKRFTYKEAMAKTRVQVKGMEVFQRMTNLQAVRRRVKRGEKSTEQAGKGQKQED